MPATTAKRLTLAIWTCEAFRGSREDARRIAERGAAAVSDMFAESGDIFQIAEPEPLPAEDHPGQLTLF